MIGRPEFRKPRWAAAAAIFLLLFGGLGFTEATGVTDVHDRVIRLFSPAGTLVVEVDDPGVSITLDGSDLVITGAGAKEIRLKPGSHTVEARKDGRIVRQELVTVTNNGRKVVRVSQDSPSLAKAATLSTEAADWERVVATLSAAEQARAVGARLKVLNPGVDGDVVPFIENGIVRGLEFNADDVSDISPVRTLTRLRSLNCSGRGDRTSSLTDLSPLSGLPLTSLTVGKGQLSDLTPLKGMPLIRFSTYSNLVDDLSPLEGMKLRHLVCANTGRVSDLSPLKGMPLETLDLSGTRIEDLTPIAGMKLEKLSLSHTKVKDLAVLAGLKLEELDISGTTISDLSQLKGLNLTSLSIAGTPVSDLSPIKGMKLTWMTCSGTKVSDLSPLNGMPLKEFLCGETSVSGESLAQIKDCQDLVHLVLFGTRVSDAGLAHLKNFPDLKRLSLYRSKVSGLSPLKDLSLEMIQVTPRNIITQGLDILRNMKSLKTIGLDPWHVWSAAEFWDRYDKGEIKELPDGVSLGVGEHHRIQGEVPPCPRTGARAAVRSLLQSPSAATVRAAGCSRISIVNRPAWIEAPTARPSTCPPGRGRSSRRSAPRSGLSPSCSSATRPSARPLRRSSGLPTAMTPPPATGSTARSPEGAWARS